MIRIWAKVLKKDKIVISIGAQPNSSPHFGTLCVFSLAFSLAGLIKENASDTIQKLKKRGIKKLKVVYSKEQPIKNNNDRIPASISFVPPTAGLIIASEVIKDILKV